MHLNAQVRELRTFGQGCKRLGLEDIQRLLPWLVTVTQLPEYHNIEVFRELWRHIRSRFYGLYTLFCSDTVMPIYSRSDSKIVLS